MIISFLKEKYPIAKWESAKNEEAFFTFGWDEFSKCLSRHDIPPNERPPQWQQQEDIEAIVHFLTTGRDRFQIGDCTISDGTQIILGTLARKYDFSGKCFSVFDSEEMADFFTFSILHDPNISPYSLPLKRNIEAASLLANNQFAGLIIIMPSKTRCLNKAPATVQCLTPTKALRKKQK